MRGLRAFGAESSLLLRVSPLALAALRRAYSITEGKRP